MVVEMGCLEGGRGGGSIAAPHASLTFARDPGDEPEQWDSSQHTGRRLEGGRPLDRSNPIQLLHDESLKYNFK